MNLPVSAPMAVCPLVAAVILVHRAEGSAGVKRLLRPVLEYRRIGWRWYRSATGRLPISSGSSRSTSTPRSG